MTGHTPWKDIKHKKDEPKDEPVTEEPYDSRPATMLHIHSVRRYMMHFTMEVIRRAGEHDASKLESPEKEAFDALTPNLSKFTYGSEEYRAALRDPAIKQHQLVNDHHPEFFGEDGIHGMNMVQLTEMICDWTAASTRTKDGDVLLSIEQNATRFGYGPEMTRLLMNTAEWLLEQESP